MFGAMGILGALVAGLSLPYVFGRDGADEADDTDQTAAQSDPDAATEGGEDSPLSVAVQDETSEAAWMGQADPEDASPSEPLARPDAPPEAVPDPEDATEAAAEAPTEDEETDTPEPLDLGGSVFDDSLEGGAGPDTLHGGYGDDLLIGDAGDDVLTDGAGNDTLLGGAGDDTLSALSADGEAARDGQDVLVGGAGDDLMVLSDFDLATGGEGADTFAFGPGLAPTHAGADDAAPAIEDFPVIEDFDADEDALVVVWDDYAAASPPVVSLEESDETPEIVRLLGNGKVLAEIHAEHGVPRDAVHLRAASSLTSLDDLS